MLYNNKRIALYVSKHLVLYEFKLMTLMAVY